MNLKNGLLILIFSSHLLALATSCAEIADACNNLPYDQYRGWQFIENKDQAMKFGYVRVREAYTSNNLAFDPGAVVNANLSISEYYVRNHCNPNLRVTWAVPRDLIGSYREFILKLKFYPLGKEKVFYFKYNVSSDNYLGKVDSTGTQMVSLFFDCFVVLYPGTQFEVSVWSSNNIRSTILYNSDCARPTDYNIVNNIEIGVSTARMSTSCDLHVFLKSFPQNYKGILEVDGNQRSLNLTCPLKDEIVFPVRRSGNISVRVFVGNSNRLATKNICVNATACTLRVGGCTSSEHSATSTGVHATDIHATDVHSSDVHATDVLSSDVHASTNDIASDELETFEEGKLLPNSSPIKSPPVASGVVVVLSVVISGSALILTILVCVVARRRRKIKACVEHEVVAGSRCRGDLLRNKNRCTRFTNNREDDSGDAKTADDKFFLNSKAGENSDRKRSSYVEFEKRGSVNTKLDNSKSFGATKSNEKSAGEPKKATAKFASKPNCLLAMPKYDDYDVDDVVFRRDSNPRDSVLSPEDTEAICDLRRANEEFELYVV